MDSAALAANGSALGEIGAVLVEYVRQWRIGGWAEYPRKNVTRESSGFLADCFNREVPRLRTAGLGAQAADELMALFQKLDQAPTNTAIFIDRTALDTVALALREVGGGIAENNRHGGASPPLASIAELIRVQARFVTNAGMPQLGAALLALPNG